MRQKTINSRGLTVIELILVIVIMGVMLSFAVPKFKNRILSDNKNLAIRTLIGKVTFLKEESVRQQKDLILHVSIDDNSIFVTGAGLKTEENDEAKPREYRFPGDIRVTDVEFPKLGKVTIGTADIYFYKKGYSDKALIHFEDEDSNYFTILIESFLPHVKHYSDYTGFEI